MFISLKRDWSKENNSNDQRAIKKFLRAIRAFVAQKNNYDDAKDHEENCYIKTVSDYLT